MIRPPLPSRGRSTIALSVAPSVALLLVGCATVPTPATLDKGVAPASATSPSPSAELARPDQPAVIHPERWPTATSPTARVPAEEARIAAFLARMTVEEKVGQIIQADIGSVTPAQAREYHLGAVLNGGNSAPGNDNRAAPAEWVKLADAFWRASTDTAGGRVGVPLMWGTDAVHGHNKAMGATLFPHNIGLGAANDADLIEEIGRVTAREVRVTGLDWTFAPTIAVARNDRWGRTYESYSEDPRIVAAYAPRIVYGLQGRPGQPGFLTGEHLMATAKHFVGDGGTAGGKDQGDNAMSEAQLRDLQAAGYVPAIEAGVQAVMASYNSWHGAKMHGFKPMLTDVLRGRFGFDGLVVGDWNGHGQVAGCTPTDCPQSLLAGLDLYMAPDSWMDLYENTLREVRAGTIPMARLDEAVGHILRVKLRSGLFEAGLPSKRPLAGRFDLLGAPEHMALARQAVRESLVLLKNDGVLPVKPGARVAVLGDGADDIGKQSGGWTVGWQGSGNTRADFPHGRSIFDGLKTAVEESGGSASLTTDAVAAIRTKPDVAVVVFGEDPYAEFQGDRDNVDFAPTDPLEQLRALKAAGVPTVSVFLSGRPLWTNPEINASDAFVAAWLPGTAGDGVADVLVAGRDGRSRQDFRGRLSFSWPKSSADAELNVGDARYDPLFAYGYGLSYAAPGQVGTLSEDKSLEGVTKVDLTNLMTAGVAQVPWHLVASDAAGPADLPTSAGRSPGGGVVVTAADDRAQEDMRLIRFVRPGRVALATDPVDLEREANGDMAVRFAYRVDQAAGARIGLVGQGGETTAQLDLTADVKAALGQGWRTGTIKLSCLGAAGVDLARLTSPFGLDATAGYTVGLRDVRLVQNDGTASCGL